jgi:hypothetical protein
VASENSKLDLLYEKLVEFEPKLDRLLTVLREKEAEEREQARQLEEQGGNHGRE